MESPTDDDERAPTLNEIIIKALNENKNIYCDNENTFNKLKLDIPNLICSYDDTTFKTYDILIFDRDYILRKHIKEDAETYWLN